MAKTDTVNVFRMSHPDDLRVSLDSIVDQLEKYGRAITSNGQASRVFSNLVRDFKNDGLVYFGKHRSAKKSIIALKPGAELKKIGNGRIRFNVKF